MPRLRQAVIVAQDLEPTVERLQDELGLGEAYRDPLVGHFGLVNAVFAVGDTFLEVVSPIDEKIPGARTAAAQLERSGGTSRGYMAMLQVESVAAARERARKASVRVVFEVDLEDMTEVHLHPGDVQGAIVALSEPRPPAGWRWAGPDWPARSVPGQLTGLTIAVGDPESVRSRWHSLAGGPVPGLRFVDRGEGDRGHAGIVAIELEINQESRSLTFEGSGQAADG